MLTHETAHNSDTNTPFFVRIIIMSLSLNFNVKFGQYLQYLEILRDGVLRTMSKDCTPSKSHSLSFFR